MLRLDMSKVEKGVRIELDDNDDGPLKGTKQFVTLAMAHAANKRYQRRLDAEMRPYRRKLQLGTMNDDKAEEIYLKVFVETIIVGWENIPLPGANPYSPEAAKQVLADPQNRLFYERLQQEAAIQEYYRLEEKEDELKN